MNTKEYVRKMLDEVVPVIGKESADMGGIPTAETELITVGAFAKRLTTAIISQGVVLEASLATDTNDSRNRFDWCCWFGVKALNIFDSNYTTIAFNYWGGGSLRTVEVDAEDGYDDVYEMILDKLTDCIGIGSGYKCDENTIIGVDYEIKE